jgi:hypothetical protein
MLPDHGNTILHPFLNGIRATQGYLVGGTRIANNIVQNAGAM